MARPITFDPQESLDRAMDLFWTRGYHRVRIQDIIQVTGLNRHSLYTRYGSKLGLLRAALERYQDAVMGRIEAILTSDLEARRRIEQFMAVREDGIADEVWGDMLERGCFALRIAAELRDVHAELSGFVDEFGNTLERLVAGVIREGQTRGEFRRDRTAEDLASVLVAGFMLPLVYAPASNRTAAYLAMLD